MTFHGSTVAFDRMQLRKINVGCFGGGTGLPSLLGGLQIGGQLQKEADFFGRKVIQ